MAADDMVHFRSHILQHENSVFINLRPRGNIIPPCREIISVASLV